VSSERPSSKIIIQVVGTVIAAAILYLFRSWLPVIGSWLFSVIRAIWTFLIAGHAIPGWLLVIFVVCTLWLTVRVLLGFRTAPSRSHEFTEDDYVKDSFFGLTWRWRYGQTGIYSVVPCCSRCDMQVHPRLDHVSTLSTLTGYHCDNCGQHVSLEGDHQNIEDKVTRQIQRKLRSGEWKQVISKESAQR